MGRFISFFSFVIGEFCFCINTTYSENISYQNDEMTIPDTSIYNLKMNGIIDNLRLITSLLNCIIDHLFLSVIKMLKQLIIALFEYRKDISSHLYISIPVEPSSDYSV